MPPSRTSAPAPISVKPLRTAAVAGLIDWHVAHPRLGKSARTLHFAPLSFDVSFQEILSTFATGGTLVVASDTERRDPWALLDLIERERVERVFLPYVALQAIADAATSAGRSAPPSIQDIVIAEAVRSADGGAARCS